MRPRPTRILTQADVAALLTADDCLIAVEHAFRAHGEGLGPPPAVAGVHAQQGSFHVKAGAIDVAGRPYFAAKVNANFMGNRQHGLPTIQGVIVLCDARVGSPLAVMDSIEITTLRTAAATALAARHLAAPGAVVLGIVGCGTQGRAHVRALSRVRSLQSVVAYDVDAAAARRLADDVGRDLGLPVHIAESPADVARRADLCVTCTPSREFLLGADAVKPGAFVAGVGVDNEGKRELRPDLLARTTIVVDVLDQCATIGDLHHALKAGAVSRDQVHAQLGEIVTGRKPGRTRADEITVFDSTGMALQDAAAAAMVYERAVEAGHGIEVSLAG